MDFESSFLPCSESFRFPAGSFQELFLLLESLFLPKPTMVGDSIKGSMKVERPVLDFLGEDTQCFGSGEGFFEDTLGFGKR